nr:ribonuclease H-like domain-containing protein [Tanacetum cinerariifolium]
MYSVDLKNIVPKGGLTCIFAKATYDESKLWHRRLDQIRLDEEADLKLQAAFDEEERLAREKAKKVKEANIALIVTWDDIHAKIDADHQC